MTLIPGYDCTTGNLAQAPGGQAAGYTTGKGIAWTPEQWAAHPYAVRICQDFGATDTTADVLDVERYAATNAEAAAWYRTALLHYIAGTRPGQRSPAIYTSQSNVTALVNTLIAAGVKSGPRLWVASWQANDAQAIAELGASGGPFPIVGVQWASRATYDLDFWLKDWLDRRSAAPDPKPAPKPARTLVSVSAIARYSDGSEQTWAA